MTASSYEQALKTLEQTFRGAASGCPIATGDGQRPSQGRRGSS